MPRNQADLFMSVLFIINISINQKQKLLIAHWITKETFPCIWNIQSYLSPSSATKECGSDDNKTPKNCVEEFVRIILITAQNKNESVIAPTDITVSMWSALIFLFILLASRSLWYFAIFFETIGFFAEYFSNRQLQSL